MKKDGMLFACLSGQRQRYGYFGFEPAGCVYTFNCDAANVRHAIPLEAMSGMDMSPVDLDSEDSSKEALDAIAEFHDRKPCKVLRDRERLFDILRSWHSKIYAVWDLVDGSRLGLLGYLVVNEDGSKITEIYGRGTKRLCAALAVYLRETGRASVDVVLQPWNRDGISALMNFAESWRVEPAYMFNVLDEEHFRQPFESLRDKLRKEPEPFPKNSVFNAVPFPLGWEQVDSI
jgi:hypothetical protein